MSVSQLLPGVEEQGTAVFLFVFSVSFFGFGFQALKARDALMMNQAVSPFFASVTYWNIVAMALAITPLTFIGILPLPPILSFILPIPAAGPTIYDFPHGGVMMFTFLFLIFAIHSVSNCSRPIYHALGADAALKVVPYAAAYPLILLLPLTAGLSMPSTLCIMVFSEIGQHVAGGIWWFMNYSSTSSQASYYGMLSVALHLTSVLPWLGYMIFAVEKSPLVLFPAYAWLLCLLFASQYCLVQTAQNTPPSQITGKSLV